MQPIKHFHGITGLLATASGFVISHWPTLSDFLHDLGSLVAIVAGIFTGLYYFEGWRQKCNERKHKKHHAKH